MELVSRLRPSDRVGEIADKDKNQPFLRAALCDVRGILRDHGMRPTRQRLALGQLLFASDGQHVTAERLYDEAVRRAIPVSLATVYNTLRQFTEAGLLREIVVDGSKTIFDTDTSDHHHFYLEESGDILDIPADHVALKELPAPPPGMEIARVDVVVRLKPISAE